MKKMLLAMLLIMSFASLSNADTRIDYVYEKPGDTGRRYEDDRISIATSIGTTIFAQAFIVSVINKTGAPITIDWEKVSIIDPRGVACRVFLGETPLINRTNPIPTSQVPSNRLAAVEKQLIPLDYVSGRFVNHFVEFPMKRGLFGDTMNEPETNTKSKVYQNFIAKYDGRKVGLYLPIIFEAGTEDYTVMYTFDFSKLKAGNIASDVNKPAVSTQISGLTFDALKIKSVESGSLADKAALKPGDTILEINGRPADEKALKDIDTRLAAGRSVMIVYERDGNKDMVTLR